MRAWSGTWWLPALCGILDALLAALNLLMLDPERSLAWRRFALPDTVRIMAVLALAAGASAIAAGLLRRGRENSWLLSLHGFALGAFGLVGISPLIKGPLSFRPVSLLFVVMALSMGVFALAGARARRRAAPARGFLAVFGAASIGFAISFFAVGFNWVRLPPEYFWIWMSSWFAFCAILMLWLAAPRHSGAADNRTARPLPHGRGSATVR
jgi:hypothetical protein